MAKTFDLEQSDLLFLLQLSDAVYNLPSEKQVFEHTCKVFAAKTEVEEVVIYEMSQPEPELKSYFHLPDNGRPAIHDEIDCTAHFELYRQHEPVLITDVRMYPDGVLFTGCHMRAVAGISLKTNQVHFLLELRSTQIMEWPLSLAKLLKNGFQRVLKAVSKIREVEDFRSRSLHFETATRALLELSADNLSSGILAFRQPVEIEHLKLALLKTVLPRDVYSNLTDEDIPKVQIEIARYFDGSTDHQIDNDISGIDQPYWVKINNGRLAGHHSQDAAIDISNITERKQYEQHQAFLFQLSDMLRIETSADEIVNLSLQMLYEYLNLDQCCAAEYHLEEGLVKHTHCARKTNDLNIPAIVKFSDFPDSIKMGLYTTLVLDDVNNALHLSGEEKLRFIGMGIGSLIVSQWHKGTKNINWSILALSKTPRHWKQSEVKLIEEVTERTWAAVERAKSREALRRSSECMRFLKEAYHSVVDDAPFEDSLKILTRLVVSETGGAARTAFFIVSENSLHLKYLKSAGNMPEDYAEAIDNLLLENPSIVSEYVVSYIEPVISPDVNTDPRWMYWIPLAKKYNYRACWSFPMKTKDNKAVGAFVMYFTNPREATKTEIELAELVTGAAAVIINTHKELQERLRIEETLAESRDQLVHNMTQQNEFLRIATHEVKTPLTVIKLTAQFLKNNLVTTEGNESAVLLVDKLNQSVVKLIGLFEHLMQTTKAADGTLELKGAIFDIHALIADVVADQQSVAPERKITNHAKGVLLIEADKSRIEQVIVNLLTNANKYSPDDTEIIIETRIVNEMIEVGVKDKGPGIASDEQEKIFKRFYRVKNSSGREGLGVGLYISDVIIKMHGGRIWVDSTPGDGSTFYFTLPLKK